MFHKRGQGHVERPCQLADTCWTYTQPTQNGSAGWVGQSLEDAVETLLILSHKAK